jgi:hypothetical protein
MEEETRKSGDLWSGLALLLLGAYIVVEASRWEYLGTDGPGAGFFPRWYGIAMGALALLLIASHFRRRPSGQSTVAWPRIRRALGVWLALAASVALFKPLGFLLSFALLTFFIVAALYRRPLRVAAAVALASAAGFYLAFPFALGVALPVGALGF